MEIRYAISDIHGNSKAFLEILDYVDPDPEQMVICGDLCNRGLDSWGVYEEVDQLIDEGCRLVLGNHDHWFSEMSQGKMSVNAFTTPDIGGITTVKSFEIAEQKHGSDHVAKLKARVLANMKAFVETDDFIFVHAGIDPRIPSMSRQNVQTLMFGCDAWRNPQLDHTFDQVVVFGHTPTYHIHRNIEENDATVWFSRNRRKMGIDTGAGFGNRLTMVDLQKGIAYAYDFKLREVIQYQFMNPKGFKRRYYS